MTGDAASGRKFGRSLRCLFVVVLIPITWLIAGADLPTVRTSTGFQFARLRYPGGIPYHIKNWYTDYPGMDEHFTRLLGRMTGIQTGDAVVLEPSSPDIFKYPLLYTVEPEQMVLRQTDIANLAEYLARGGLWFADDFHGNEEFDLFWEQIQRVLPESSLVELDISHPIFHCFYDIPKIVQVTNDGIAKCRQCEQWENGPSGKEPKMFAVLDQRQRISVLMAWNTDLGDGLEWADDREYPAEYSTFAFKFITNLIVYTMSH